MLISTHKRHQHTQVDDSVVCLKKKFLLCGHKKLIFMKCDIVRRQGIDGGVDDS